MVDTEFASYVDARQGRWLRTAYLVYGDLERAEEALLHAFTRLALRWTKVDDPDAFVRAVRDAEVIGASYYTLPFVTAEQWTFLGRIAAEGV